MKKKQRISVGIRVRPSMDNEKLSPKAVEVDELHDKIKVLTSSGSSSIQCTFDRVFPEHSKQCEIYQFMQPTIEQVIEGYNATIFAYGQTGTGKTYSMLGRGVEMNSGNISKDDWGIIPRAVENIFHLIHNYTKSNSPNIHDTNSKIIVKCSYLQIYNDRIYDLLKDKNRQNNLLLREEDGVLQVQGLSTVMVHNVSEVLILLRRGRSNRTNRETEYNTHSSRSHAILQLSLTINEDLNLEVRDNEVISKFAKLSLVDLAGSEKWNTSIGMEECHEIELRNINSSLSALGNCMAALTENGRKHIPYRDSVLTRLLQDSLGGNTNTLILATISSLNNAADETIRTLLFADRAKSVMQRVKMNKAINGSIALASAREEICILQKRMAKLQKLNNPDSPLKQKQSQFSLNKTIEKIQKDLQVKESRINELLIENKNYRGQLSTRESEIITLKEIISTLKDKNRKIPIPKLVIKSSNSIPPPQIKNSDVNKSNQNNQLDKVSVNLNSLNFDTPVINHFAKKPNNMSTSNANAALNRSSFRDRGSTGKSQMSSFNFGLGSFKDLDGDANIGNISNENNHLLSIGEDSISSKLNRDSSPSVSPLFPEIANSTNLKYPSNISVAKCERHELSGCVLCAMQKTYQSTSPKTTDSTIENEKLPEISSIQVNTYGKCEKHQLSECILCCDSQKRKTSYKKENNSSHRIQNICSRHNLTNCILCLHISSQIVQDNTGDVMKFSIKVSNAEDTVRTEASVENFKKDEHNFSIDRGYADVKISNNTDIPIIMIPSPKPNQNEQNNHNDFNKSIRKKFTNALTIKGRHSKSIEYASPNYVRDALKAATNAISIRKR